MDPKSAAGVWVELPSTSHQECAGLFQAAAGLFEFFCRGEHPQITKFVEISN